MYTSKIKEWQVWCSSKQFIDYDHVTEAKLVAFLKLVVVPRGNKRRSSEEVHVPLGHEAIEAYIKSIVHLWKHQISAQVHSNPHPRTGEALKVQ
jgi:hypothetical protein